MGDRSGLCGAGLMEIEARHNATMTCPVKSREGKGGLPTLLTDKRISNYELS